MKSKLTIALACLAILVLSLAAFFLVYRDVHPLGGIRLHIGAGEAGEKAAALVQGVFPEVRFPQPEAQLSRNDELIRVVLARLGREQGTAVLQESVPGYFWAVRWEREDSSKIVVVSGDEQISEAQQARGKRFGGILVRLTTAGELLGFEWKLNDTAAATVVPPDSSRQRAEEFRQRHFSYLPGWIYTGEKRMERAKRTDTEYSWEAPVAPLEKPATLKITMAGTRILDAGITYPVPAPASGVSDNTLRGVVTALLTVVLIVLMIVAGFRRIRAYEVSFRLGLILGILVALAFGIELYLRIPGNAEWDMVVSLFLGPLFLGGFFILAWSIAESVGREAWPDKFTSLDLLMKGYMLHGRVGRSVLQGLALGGAACIVWALVVWGARMMMPDMYVPADRDTLMFFSGQAPVFSLIARSLHGNAYLYTTLLLFVMSLTRFRVRSPLVLVLVGAFAIGMVNREGIVPGVAGFLVSAIAALILSWGFYKFDLVTSFIGLAVMSMFMVAPSFFTVGNDAIAQSGFVFGGILTLVAAYGAWTMLSKERPVDLDSVTPAFVKHITERERLHRELEIARDVQMSFLPRRNPVIPGVEIASHCAPALEVGGDYYDFVNLGPDHFGVVVGDVSGKGTQAAFYMTLTKGFLKAVTRVSKSPAEVLTQLNDLFYENVERGTFISMVYAIFDLRQRTVTIARAGHNPPVYKGGKKEEAEYVQPTGLALGLEAGPAFTRAIQEHTKEICPGDLFVFYTDGFTEAMNRAREEFGEERLRRSVAQHAAGGAARVMDGLFADVKSFAGKASQHDDMTIVAIRIT